MQAALKRKRDQRQPADSGEYLPVPIRYITLKPAKGPAYGTRQPGAVAPRCARGRRILALLAVMLLQGALVVAIFFAAVVSLYAGPDWLAYLLMFATPALATALTCAIVGPILALRHDRWQARGLRLVGKAAGLWVLLIPVACLFMGRGIHAWQEVVLGLVVLAMAGVFLFVLSLPGLFVLILLEGPIERIARYRRRRAAARYHLTCGWRAP